MSGLVTTADLCTPWLAQVKPGWRGPWPCAGEVILRNHKGEPFGLAECSCPCHADGPQHQMPRLSGRTAVHPTDVLADE